MEELIVKIDGKEYKVKVEETEHGTLKIHCGKDIYEIDTKPAPKNVEIAQGDLLEDNNIIKSPLPGTIIGIMVRKGQHVTAGEPLIKLVAMKMENEITSTKDGTISKINVKKKDNVNKGDVLIILE